MNKEAGAPCPSCGKPACAEYKAQGRKPQWRCAWCEASGPLTSGTFYGKEVGGGKSEEAKKILPPLEKTRQVGDD